MAREQCIGERPSVIWLHVVSDSLIALAYYSIPLALIALVRLRRDLAFGWMFFMFATFIMACGTTHVFDVLAFWYPAYRLDGVVKAGTAIVSVATAISLWPLIPRAVRLPSPGQLRDLNDRLLAEVDVRREAEQSLALANTELEERVMHRTAELASANEALRSRLVEIDALYRGAAAGLCRLDNDFVITRCNESFAHVVGRSPRLIRGMRLGEILPELEASIASAKSRGPATQQDNWNLSFQIPATSPEVGERAFVARVQRENDSERSGAGFALGLVEVTDRVRLESQLQQSQKLEAVGQLASGVAHDISNTLTAVYGYLSMARSLVTPDNPVSELLDKVGLAAEQASRMTRSLLLFARPDPAKREPFDAAQVVSESVTIVRGMMASTIELSVDTTSAQDAWLMGNPTQLQQVIMNLAINARDAMPSGGRLTISVRREGEVARIVVADTGAGISPEHIPRIFDPFFTTKPRGQGTGLGLSVVQSIVRAMDGRIDVRSTLGLGTSFTMEFPALPPPVGRSAAGAELLEKPAPIGAAIALADDNVHVRETVAFQLRRAGYAVATFDDGKAVLEAALSERRFAAMIIDVDMPRMSGTDALREMRRAGLMTPVLLITGGSADGYIVDQYTSVLAKPFSSAEFLRAVSAAVASAASLGPDNPPDKQD
ncbi:MAG: ATP-binding protein [Planctomycetota bacterium]|nr:ATP-binding protein [Planctomycetota bacterium]